jgi:type IV secretory pathway TrbL component
MTTGLAQTTYINAVLNAMHRSVALTTSPGNFIELHTADPGAAGTTSPASVTTRPAATFSAPSASAIALSNTPTWASWAGTSPTTVTHIAEWDASTAGNFKDSAALTTSKTVQTGDTLTLTSMTISFAPTAA